jgi:hypothetical protein
MRALAMTIAIVLAVGAGSIQTHGGAPTAIILAADDTAPPEATAAAPEAGTAAPEQGSGQTTPEAPATPSDLSKTGSGKPAMGCCTMESNGAVRCKC